MKKIICTISGEIECILCLPEVHRSTPEYGDQTVLSLQVKLSVFFAYLKSIGVLLSMVIILFYVLYNVASVYSNIWLSEWSNDLPIRVNGTNGTVIEMVDTDKRDLRLGVYGALGFLQGRWFSNFPYRMGCGEEVMLLWFCQCVCVSCFDLVNMIQNKLLYAFSPVCANMLTKTKG